MPRNDNPLAKIPQVEKLLSHQALRDMAALLGRPLVKEITTEYLEGLRKGAMGPAQAEQLPEGLCEPPAAPSIEDCAQAIRGLCEPRLRKRICRVINATGIVLHTNLGRSPLPAGVWEKAAAAGASYSSIEMDLDEGLRGQRFEFLRDCMRRLCGSQDALVVNNNAAAVYLCLKTLAEGREVIVSRGQQVQIGGGFRIPEILQLAGCRLVEVGTTNITTLDDIRKAIKADTALVLWVHSSNYKIRGFTDSPSIRDIKAMLPAEIPLLVDQGSGNLFLDIPEEPTVPEILKQGADLVCFSGDKILGGPQAGWIVGASAALRRIAAHPLMRSYRIGKAVAALMEATLIHYLNNEQGETARVFAIDPEALAERGRRIAAALPQGFAELVAWPFSPGGGSTPDMGFPSWALRLISTKNPEALKRSLRLMSTPIVGFIADDSLMIHLATIDEADDEYLARCLDTLLQG